MMRVSINITAEPQSEITVELFEVDDLTFTRIESLEGYPKMYSRTQENFKIEGGETCAAWIYYQNSFEGDKIIENGDWIAYRAKNVGDGVQDTPY